MSNQESLLKNRDPLVLCPVDLVIDFDQSLAQAWIRILQYVSLSLKQNKIEKAEAAC